MAEPFTNITVVLKNGATNNRPITGNLVVEPGGTNTAQLTGYLEMTGGSNSGTVTGAASITSATNSGNVSGDVFLSNGTLVTGASVGGRLYVTGANSVVPSGVIPYGQIILSSDAPANLGVLNGYSGTVISRTGEYTLISTIYSNGPTQTATTLTDAVYYNLEADNKAYHYSAGAKEVFTGNAYNLTGDGKAYSWSGGEKGAVFVGTLYSGTEGEAGYTRIVIDANDAVTITAVDHQYNTESYYYDTSPITDGATVYTGRYTDALAAADATFTIGSNGDEGYGTVTVGASGIASVVLVNHSFSTTDGSNQVYFDNGSPIVGDLMYTGQYSTTTSTSSFSFYVGAENTNNYNLVVVTSGAVSSVTAVNHPYSFTTTSNVTIYFDSATPAADASVYTGQYTDAKYTTAFTAYSGTEGNAGYSRITQAATPGTVAVEAADHQYTTSLPGGTTTIYHDAASLASGATVYSGRYTFALAAGVNWHTGQDGQAGYTANDITEGVYTSNVVSHQYNTVYDAVTYYHAAANITPGSTVYSNQYTLGSYPAEGTIFVSSANKITIGASGVAATVLAINHAYLYTYVISNISHNAYGDASTLTDGDILYTGQYSIIPVADIPTTAVGTEGSAGYGSFTTNASGVVNVTYIDHQFTTTGGIAADSAFPTTAVSAMTLQTYVNRYSMQSAAATSFRAGGLVYTIVSGGNLSTAANFSGYESGQVWVDGSQIPGTFNEPFESRDTCDGLYNIMKLSTTGLNTSDKVYKTATSMTGASWSNITPEAYVGTFITSGSKYNVDNTGIIGVVACSSDNTYPD
jgi:hypothetical protein